MNDTTKVILVSIVLAACIVLLGGLVIMVLWNWLIPDLLGWPTVTYWQSTGISLAIGFIRSAFVGFSNDE
jgi:hypothetical protein